MATEKTDVVIVGVGGTGAILAAELGKAGIKVIGLERGPRHATADFVGQDELRYFQRQDLRPNPKRQPVTWRKTPRSSAITRSRRRARSALGKPLPRQMSSNQKESSP
jgi:gluconate 2-dehydrogenase alpha chain